MRPLTLKIERHKRGWTQNELGYLAKVASYDISNHETGRRPLKPDELARVRRVLSKESATSCAS